MVAALAQENALPTPQLDLTAVASSNSGFANYQPEIRAPMPTRAYSEDPWSAPKFPSAPAPAPNGNSSLANGAPSNISGTGLPSNWWKKQETVTVNILGQQGFILNRYLVYEVATDVCRVTDATCFLANGRTACATGASSILRICHIMGLLSPSIPLQTTSVTSSKEIRT